MNIWNITQELDKVFFDIEENDGEIDENLAARLSISEEDLHDKIDGYAMYIKALKSNNQLIKDEIESFRSKIKSNEARIKYLNTNILIPVIKRYGEDTGKNYRFKTAVRSLWTVIKKVVKLDDDFANSNYIKKDLTLKGLDTDEFITMMDIVDDNEFETMSSPKIDKKALKVDLENGDEIDGATLEDSESLTIR